MLPRMDMSAAWKRLQKVIPNKFCLQIVQGGVSTVRFLVMCQLNRYKAYF